MKRFTLGDLLVLGAVVAILTSATFYTLLIMRGSL